MDLKSTRPFSAEYLAMCDELDLADRLDRLGAVLEPKVGADQCPTELQLHGYRLRQDIHRSHEFGERGIAGQIQLAGADSAAQLNFGYYARHDGSTWAWARFGFPSPTGVTYHVTLQRDATGLWIPNFPGAMTTEFYRASHEFLDAVMLIEQSGIAGHSSQ